MTSTTVDAAGSRARLDRLAAVASPTSVVTAMVGLYVAVFGHLTWRQHSHWNSLGFDTGIYDQGIWLLSRGDDPFMTMRGMDYWGHHVSLIGLPLAALYRVGAGIHELTLIHTTVVGLAAVPLYLLTRDRTGRPWLALVVPLAWLLHPAVHWVTWWLYHPDSLAITPLLFAWWLAGRQRWGWFAAGCGIAMACKEDVALAVAAIGLGLVVRGERRAGALTVAAGVAWFLICTKLVIPWRNGEPTAFYESYFPTLGTGLGDIAYNSVRHPSRVLGLLARDRNPDYALKMLGPLGFVTPLLGPLGLLAGVPSTTVNVLVEVQNGATIKSQYASMPLVGVFLGAAEGLGWLARRSHALVRLAAVLMVACSLVATNAWGLSPLGRTFSEGVWGTRPRANAPQLHEALRLIPADGRVSGSWNVVTQLSHRRTVYEFPNPWISSNYGITGNEVDDPSSSDWLFIERSALGAKDQAFLDMLIGPDGDFMVVYDRAAVVVAQRWRADTVGNP